jgi:hypothetical protein
MLPDVTPWTWQIQLTVAIIPGILPSSDRQGVDLLQHLGSRSGLQHDWLHHLASCPSSSKRNVEVPLCCLKELSLTAYAAPFRIAAATEALSFRMEDNIRGPYVGRWEAPWCIFQGWWS